MRSTKLTLMLISLAVLAVMAFFLPTDIVTITGLGMLGVATALDDAIAALTAQVSQTTTVDGSATALVNSIPSLIQKAVDAALAQGATPTQLSELTDLVTALKNGSTPLAAAVAQNPPAATS